MAKLGIVDIAVDGRSRDRQGAVCPGSSGIIQPSSRIGIGEIVLNFLISNPALVGITHHKNGGIVRICGNGILGDTGAGEIKVFRPLIVVLGIHGGTDRNDSGIIDLARLLQAVQHALEAVSIVFGGNGAVSLPLKPVHGSGSTLKMSGAQLSPIDLNRLLHSGKSTLKTGLSRLPVADRGAAPCHIDQPDLVPCETVPLVPDGTVWAGFTGAVAGQGVERVGKGGFFQGAV